MVQYDKTDVGFVLIAPDYLVIDVLMNFEKKNFGTTIPEDLCATFNKWGNATIKCKQKSMVPPPLLLWISHLSQNVAKVDQLPVAGLHVGGVQAVIAKAELDHFVG